MGRIKCFLLERTLKVKRELRCYASESKCDKSGFSYHNVANFLDIVERQLVEIEPEEEFKGDKSLWPTKCLCGYVFTEKDIHQVFSERLYKRSDTGEEIPLGGAPPGAMWDAYWMSDDWKGSDGKSIVVVTPGGEWMVDSRASNCTMPNDNVHKCWVRHGIPPELTVDKNGNTCGAGGGSIQAGKYHGFLRNGWLED